MRPPPDADLSLDLDGLDRFAGALENLNGQWDGTNNQIGDIDWVAGDTDFLDALNSFTRSWANAATLINTYSAQLSSMARASAAQFQQTDSNLAGQTPRGRRPIAY
ncbi:hypothetical protein KGQ20_02250 [Catenulispora sp. NF23]|uniref:WXG100 family type VII secretion target n=1 Tax=Catenulispora pinistramenti TaxID=2705254 RepID=A0ABS5KJ46_9ACTN|nr:hypothetical protein [Catenulispora pinistramenti]MBS2531587.1 hypothetical protein [Catenulispora pinistramenti]MBS2546163.1 hypothetical protein [Catenulispora pinistramenti]